MDKNGAVTSDLAGLSPWHQNSHAELRAGHPLTGPALARQTRPLQKKLESLEQIAQDQQDQSGQQQPEGIGGESEVTDDPQHAEDDRNPEGDDFGLTKFHNAILLSMVEKDCPWAPTVRPVAEGSWI